MISPKYDDSEEFVKKGDWVYVDDLRGQIKEVCLPKSRLARAYSCQDSGGLLILFEDGILELRNFGAEADFRKAPPGQ